MLNYRHLLRLVLNLSLLLLLTLFVTGCNNYKTYYYSSYPTATPRIYEYTNRENPSETQYWRMSPEGNLLLTQAYDASFSQFESFTEEIAQDGSILKEYINFDSEGNPLSRKVKSSEVFKWKENGPYEYAIEFEEDGEKIFFRKTREFIEKTTISIFGKNQKALKYKGVYQFGLVGAKAEYEYFQYSYYVQKLGMVKYERYFPDKSKTILELTRIFTEQEWLEKIK